MTDLRNHRSTNVSLVAIRLCIVSLILLATTTFARGDEKEKEKKADEVPQAPAAPDPQLLKGLLEDLFGPPRPMGPRAPRPNLGRQPAPEEKPDSQRDPIDNRAPRDVKVEQLLSAAETGVKQKNWKSAVQLCQRLLDQPEDSLHRAPNGQWQSVRQTANQMLSQMPETVLSDYRSQYGGLAQQQLNMARRSGLTADFVQVATRFFHTPAGYEAAYYLASQHFDRSEYGLAARWFHELAGSSAEITRKDPWLLQAALALSRAGDAKEATALLARMSAGPDTVVNLPTGAIKASEFINQAQTDVSVRPNAMEDWMQFYGTASRVGSAVGGDAILSPNWSIPLTSSHTVRNSVKWLIHDLQDQQRSLILAAIPLVIQGKVFYRDLRGVRSVDIESGLTLWESVEGVSPERIVGGLPSQQVDPQDAWRPAVTPTPQGDYQGLSAEYSPLTSLLFRDGTYGLISSDGKQLFVIEEQGVLSRNQPGQHWGWDGTTDPQDPYGLSWKSNRLVSYDLKTGRMLWSVGGTESRESFDLPLAGSYFYGAPAVDNSELFVVVGKGDDIRLWSLDRNTGVPNWSQLIAYSDTKIDVDIARRWVTSQVGVGNGIVVCPTTVGWLVAIDRLRQSVLWAHRYVPRAPGNLSERDPGSQILPQRELNGLWCPSAPIISDSYVVYTPQEEPILICLNAIDGRRLWEKPKDRGLYLAGVFNRMAVVVGENAVIAYDLADGHTVWTSTIEEGIRPSGRGIAVDDRFYLPLSNGELQSIDLSSGKVMSQTYVGSKQPPLGNLAMHHGKLISLGTSGLTAFGQRDALLAEIDKRLSLNPNDAWALLRSSEIRLLNHQYADALPMLRKIAVKELTEDERSRHHAALTECLSTLIHSDILNRKAELDEFGKLASSPAERLQFHELTAEQLLAERKPLEAFEIFSNLADEPGDDFVVRTDDRHISARRTVWLSGRMSEIWTATENNERRMMDERITKLVAEASSKSADACHRAATLFSFHPAAVTARQHFVEWLIDANDLSGARLVLEQLVDDSDPKVAAIATERLARLMLQSGLPDDAVYYYRRLETRFADVPLKEGQTGAMIAAQARKANEKEFEPHARGVIWRNSPLKLEQLVVNYTQPSQDVLDETSLPFFSKLSMESYQSEQRVALESVASGQVEWMMPLRSTVRGNDEGFLVTRRIGHQMYFVNRGVLHAVSPIERRVLWWKPLEDTGDGSSLARHSNRMPISSMLSASRDDSQSLLMQRAYSSGHLAVVQPNYLCVYGRRSLSVLDPRTGDELWKLESLPMNAQVLGHRDAVFVIVPGKVEAMAYRVLDGMPLNIPDAAKLLNSALMTHGSSLLLFEAGGRSPIDVLGIRRRRSAKCTLRLYDPLTRKTQWQIDYPGSTQISPLGDDEIVTVQSDGQVQRIDVGSGKVTALEPIPARRGILERYLLADDDRIYLVSNTLDSGGQSYGESLPSIRVNGTVAAWSRDDNRLIWQRQVKQQNLVIDRFAKMPVMLFVSRTWKPRGRMNVSTLSIEAIHKQSGDVLIDSKTPSVYSGFHALSINADEPSIELKSYNVRMRLIPTDGPVAEAATPTSSAPKN